MSQATAVPGAFAQLLLPELREILARSPGELDDATSEIHPADLAELVAALKPREQRTFLTALPPARSADVLEHLDDTTRKKLLIALDDRTAASILNAAAADDRADMLAKLPPSRAATILSVLARAVREETAGLLAYPPNTAGGRMTTEFVALPEKTRVDQALALVRRAAREKEALHTLYLTGAANEIIGVVSMQALLAADDRATLIDVADKSFQSVPPLADQEEVATLISKYDLLAMPVVDVQRRLLGIVTVDDVVDVVVEEATEDVQRLGGVSPIEEGYFQAGFWSLVRKRGLWLLVIFVGELLTGTVLRRFEDEFRGTLSLVFFIPLILSSGGNSGSQSATLVTRGLAVGDVRLADFARIFGREVVMGLTLGAFLGAVGFVRAMMWHTGAGVSAVVGMTLAGVVMAGSIVGALLPLGFKRLGVDPAFASSPFVASLVDVVGIVLYVLIAKAVLGV
ncbi:MAG: magnesium transporter [Myxococcota bacterium]